MRHFSRATARRGVTLVELLVVIIIISVLSTLVIAFGPTLGEKQRASRGADQLQGWFFLAKQRALRDQKPRGLRLIADSTSTFATTVPGAAGAYVRQLQLIEQPEPLQGVIQFLIPLIQDTASNGLPQNSCYVVADLYPPPPNAYGNGDYTTSKLVNQPLAIDSNGKKHYDVNDLMQIGTESFRIVNVEPWLWNQWPSPPPLPHPYISNTPMPNSYGPPPQPVPPQYMGKSYQQLLTANNRPGTVFRLDHYPTGHTMNDSDALQFVGKTFSIIRAPQPLAGEPTLDMPRDIAIDLSRCYPGGGSGGWLHDIMFAPSGKVVGQFSGFGRLCLCVRDVALPVNVPVETSRPMSSTIIDQGGSLSLITIYTRTGKIAPHLVDPTARPRQGTDQVPQSDPNYANVLVDPFSFTKDGLSSGL